VLSAIFIGYSYGFAQFRVAGKITDEKGESLIGVNVLVKNNTFSNKTTII
jgi:hypothetical protein